MFDFGKDRCHWPKRCKDCGTLFTPGSNRQTLCRECGRAWRREKQRGYLKASRQKKSMEKRVDKRENCRSNDDPPALRDQRVVIIGSL